jgi:hypothetical protein
MPDILAAVDEVGATDLIHAAELALGTRSAGGSSSLGPFTAAYSASASFSGGAIALMPPNICRIDKCAMSYSLSFTFSLDLSSILPQICLPQVCIPTPFGSICTPKICLPWPPPISVPVSFSDSLTFSTDFTIDPSLNAGVWDVNVDVVGIPFLQLHPASVALLAAIGSAVVLAALAVPFIGPFLALLAALVTAAIAIAGATGLLGAILTPFVTGLSFKVYSQPQNFQVLPPAGTDPAVDVFISNLATLVEASDKNELVLTAEI